MHEVALYYRKPRRGGCKVRTRSLLLTTRKRKQWGGLYPADPKGRRLAPCDFVCKAAQTPHAGAWRRTTARTRGLSLTKGSRMAASETLVYLFSYSLPNQYQKQQKRRREEDTQKHTRKQTNACSVCVCGGGAGGELEHGAISSSYLSLSALALNESSSTLGHITFVLYKSL